MSAAAAVVEDPTIDLSGGKFLDGSRIRHNKLPPHIDAELKLNGASRVTFKIPSSGVYNLAQSQLEFEVHYPPAPDGKFTNVHTGAWFPIQSMRLKTATGELDELRESDRYTRIMLPFATSRADLENRAPYGVNDDATDCFATPNDAVDAGTGHEIKIVQPDGSLRVSNRPQTAIQRRFVGVAGNAGGTTGDISVRYTLDFSDLPTTAFGLNKLQYLGKSALLEVDFNPAVNMAYQTDTAAGGNPAPLAILPTMTDLTFNLAEETDEAHKQAFMDKVNTGSGYTIVIPHTEVVYNTIPVAGNQFSTSIAVTKSWGRRVRSVFTGVEVANNTHVNRLNFSNQDGAWVSSLRTTMDGNKLYDYSLDLAPGGEQNAYFHMKNQIRRSCIGSVAEWRDHGQLYMDDWSTIQDTSELLKNQTVSMGLPLNEADELKYDYKLDLGAGHPQLTLWSVVVTERVLRVDKTGARVSSE